MLARQKAGLPLPDIEPPAPGKEFGFAAKFANRRALLTYKTHLNKDAWIEWISTKTGLTPDFVRLAHETGDKTNPYEHTHCVIDFGKNFQTTNMSYFDYENIHPHIRVLKNVKALADAKTYIAKEDPANKDLLTIQTPIAEMVWSKDTLQEALKLCKRPGDATGIIALFQAKEEERQELPEWRITLKQQWQFDIVEQFAEPTTIYNFRKIHWYYETTGDTGKTECADHLKIKHKPKWIRTGAFQNASDASLIFYNASKKGWTGHGCILNLPRQAETRVGFYQILEDLKDGCITSSKYMSEVRYLGLIPHVLVFANWLPNFSKLSKDRWVLHQLIRRGPYDHYIRDIEVTDQMYRDSASDMSNT